MPESLAQPVPEGGVAIGGKPGLPLGKASFGDKLIGNFDRFLGTLTCSSEQAELGRLRARGGKQAMLGEARVE